MKQTLVCILAACLVHAWGISAVRADGATPPPPTALYDPIWPGVVQAPLSPIAQGGDAPLEDLYPFGCGGTSLEFLSSYFVPTRIGPHGARIDYIPQDVRFGVCCNDPHSDWSWLRGVFQLLLEYNYSPIVSARGNYFTGPNAILRYNFIYPKWAVIPYLQGGAGFVLNDAYRDPAEQKLIGEAFEFLLRTEIGAHLMVTESIALDVEAGFQHISNAGIAERNGGANSIGFAVGVTYFFSK